MPEFNVYVYPVVCVKIVGVEAETPKDAVNAAIARTISALKERGANGDIGYCNTGAFASMEGEFAKYSVYLRDPNNSVDDGDNWEVEPTDYVDADLLRILNNEVTGVDSRFVAQAQLFHG